MHWLASTYESRAYLLNQVKNIRSVYKIEKSILKFVWFNEIDLILSICFGEIKLNISVQAKHGN